ncbi:AbrB/MazE/SpoVT family DNA-binding domain-containing protein [Ellagibacter isourolithinifaciens]|uniref:AbrB/MazE/SpoVT family DNA-binding domain-containing protein n=1 Tax=Ellagibacter isourolithinifaciens TaxID=2137581 RepID=UPI003A90670A
MTFATIRAWGNSKGLIIPKQICDMLGLAAGDRVSIKPNAKKSAIEIAPMKRKYTRDKVLTAEDVFSGWSGTYSLPDDLRGPASRGEECSWGEPVGKEMW